VVKQILLPAAAGLGLAAYAVRGKSSSLIAPSVWHGNRKRRAIALTFDDGPSESTPALLDLLAKHNVKATFFMCGQNVRRLKEIAARVAEEGHEIGNHTESHAALYLKSPQFIARELTLGQESISKITKVTPRWFRAPFGVRWPGLRQAQENLNLTGLMWTAIGNDWKWPASKISQKLLKQAENGGIFCLHDGRELKPSPDISATLSAVETILPILKDRGFSLETVTEILR
jgi:peptidoglycan/xylan/chitin deacetylase (PgdA/CDA1 family)